MVGGAGTASAAGTTSPVVFCFLRAPLRPPGFLALRPAGPDAVRGIGSPPRLACMRLRVALVWHLMGPLKHAHACAQRKHRPGPLPPGRPRVDPADAGGLAVPPCAPSMASPRALCASRKRISSMRAAMARSADPSGVCAASRRKLATRLLQSCVW